MKYYAELLLLLWSLLWEVVAELQNVNKKSIQILFLPCTCQSLEFLFWWRLFRCTQPSLEWTMWLCSSQWSMSRCWWLHQLHLFDLLHIWKGKTSLKCPQFPLFSSGFVSLGNSLAVGVAGRIVHRSGSVRRWLFLSIHWSYIKSSQVNVNGIKWWMNDWYVKIIFKVITEYRWSHNPRIW